MKRKFLFFLFWLFGENLYYLFFVLVVVVVWWSCRKVGRDVISSENTLCFSLIFKSRCSSFSEMKRTTYFPEEFTLLAKGSLSLSSSSYRLFMDQNCSRLQRHSFDAINSSRSKRDLLRSLSRSSKTMIGIVFRSLWHDDRAAQTKNETFFLTVLLHCLKREREKRRQFISAKSNDDSYPKWNAIIIDNNLLSNFPIFCFFMYEHDGSEKPDMKKRRWRQSWRRRRRRGKRKGHLMQIWNACICHAFTHGCSSCSNQTSHLSDCTFIIKQLPTGIVHKSH